MSVFFVTCEQLLARFPAFGTQRKQRKVQKTPRKRYTEHCSNLMQVKQEVANDMVGICHVIHCVRCVNKAGLTGLYLRTTNGIFVKNVSKHVAVYKEELIEVIRVWIVMKV